ncbi:MAG: hypothetical protein WC900_07905 [Oscillospiraceae bacterium]|jgi:alpha-galactosidase
MKRKAALLSSALMVCIMMFAFGGCNMSDYDEYGDKNANRAVPSDSLTLEISKDSSGKTIYGIGTELDPHFLYANVGRNGMDNEGNDWICKEEDWDNIIVPRIKEMKLSRLRVMLLPSWYAPAETNYVSKNYTWDSQEMQSLYKVLDLAQECGMDVNITLWGADANWIKDGSGWVDIYKDRTVFCILFADAIKYLTETKEYDCLNEITPFNEPNSLFYALGLVKGKKEYVDMCIELDSVFKEYGIRDKVKFNLSDDARDAGWLANTLENLEGICDIVNSHTYDFDATMSNNDIQSTSSYNLKEYSEVFNEYGLPHIFGEFGTNNIGENSHTCANRWTAERGLQIARIALNMLYSGSSGFSYWVLFSQYYSKTDTQIMEMGLWGFADEAYACRPVYYSYSLFSRFTLKESDIFVIPMTDDNIIAIALRHENDWTYLVVNDSTEAKKISFLNNTKFPDTMDKYLYNQNDVPENNNLIESSGKINADGRVLTDTLLPMSFTVYTTLEG